MRRYFSTLGLAVACSLPVVQAQAPSEGPPGGIRSGYGVFQTNCSGCHGNPDVQRAPDPNTLRQMSPEKIYEALTIGAMKVMAEKLSDQQKRVVAEAVSGRSLGSLDTGDASRMPNQCANNPPLTDPARSAAWNGGGVD